MSEPVPEPHHTVSEVMRRWPQTIALFLQYRTACPGCPVGAFHTIEDAALEYRIPLRTLLADLRASVRNEEERGGPRKTRPADRPRKAALRARVQPD